ncbi:nucleopolyhedrovirus P10 family protein [Streptomyces tagetis]|uniref:Nucleopolyhedrovirus P10 family protein n=1 Tax=Streptomyces tagetis TaxID=2820809 RepID=A0A940XKW1_9ACTN|nr:nucleopolyhedrovirus P10 family protein [Streptomyces sp. RG38]MBQ0830295.1 nucleopolyhedrovirus P10 family protein [Streptomyces sp. RG38]
MTTAQRWTRTVREQLGHGRFLPLGGPLDGVWITERAARGVLLAAAGEVPGARPGTLRVGPAEEGDVREPVVPAPPSGLPPGPLRVTADFAATAARPLPETADRLRQALAAAAGRFGLAVTEVDLRATDLLDPSDEGRPGEPGEPGEGVGSGRGGAPGDGRAGAGSGEAGAADGRPENTGSDASVRATGGPARGPRTPGTDGPASPGSADVPATDEERVAGVVLGVAGVDRLTGTLGRAVHLSESAPGPAALARRHVRVELAVGADHPPLEVALRVRAAVSDALPDHPTVAVLVTAVG